MSEKRCLVLGGSGALGRVVCRILAEGGARIALTYHTHESVARAVCDEIPGARAFSLDLRSLHDIEAVIGEAAAHLGGLDALIQCAGVAITVECAGAKSHHRMPQVDEEAWQRIMDVNVRSTFFSCRKAIEHMRGGNIVLMGSVDTVKPAPTPVHYAASKGALRGMTQAMAKELGELGIKVNMVAPGIMEDGISRDLPDNILAEYLKHCGLKRVAKVAEVAALVAWLAIENTYVTGQTIVVDGAL